MPNGDILDILKDRISTELGKKRISSANKTQLEVLQLFVTYLEDDHTKVAAMWSVFKPMAWGMSIASVTFIGMLVSGKVEILIK